MSEISERYNTGDDIAANMRAHQVKTVRYQVYIFCLAVFLVFFWPTFISSVETVRGQGSMDKLFSLGEITNIGYNATKARGEGGKLAEIEEVEKKIQEVQDKISSITKDARKAELLNEPEKQRAISRCLNDGVCKYGENSTPDQDALLLNNLDLFRTYIVVNDSLTGRKMPYNQEVLLKNIEGYLLKTRDESIANAVLNGVTFESPSQIDPQFPIYELPITLELEFENSTNLSSFLENIEERVNSTIGVLYKVESLDYNVVLYNEPQSLRVGLIAYYIENQDKRKEADDTSDDDETLAPESKK